MTPEVRSIIEGIFVRSTQEGPSHEPKAVARALAAIDSATDHSARVDVRALEEGIDEEFPFRKNLAFHGDRPGPNETDLWTQAIRWLFHQVLEVDASQPNGPDRVQVLLAALGALDVGCAGLDAITGVLEPTSAAASAKALLDVTGFEVTQRAGTESESSRWVRKVLDDAKEGKLGWLRQALEAVDYSVNSDIGVVVHLLWRLRPDELSAAVSSRNSPSFSRLVCQVLHENAPEFALQVPNVVFKFASLPYLRVLEEKKPDVDVQNVLTRMLVQVAQTPQWREWLKETYASPQAGSLESAALAKALAQLEQPQWCDFVEATALSTAVGAPEALADILVQFMHLVGPEKSRRMWDLAYPRWDAWDYGKGEDQNYLPSPRTCAFDFPVAMYFAHRPAEELNALIAELEDKIANIEQQWFTSESEVYTERNRLASRLRLVRHGQELANGNENALPARVQPANDYESVRYHFFDVDAALRRAMGR